MSSSSNNSLISVHPLTDNPTEAWKMIKTSQKVFKIQPPLPKGPAGDNKVRHFFSFFKFSCLSMFLLSGKSCVYE